MKSCFLLASILVVFACASTNQVKLYGTIPNENKAIEIVKELLLKEYPKKEIEYFKFKVTTGSCDSTDSWIVNRVIPENMEGGDVYFEITKNKGKICKFKLGQ